MQHHFYLFLILWMELYHKVVPQPSERFHCCYISNSPNCSTPKYVFPLLCIAGEIVSCGFSPQSTESVLRFMLFKVPIKHPLSNIKTSPKVPPFLAETNSQCASINCWMFSVPCSSPTSPGPTASDLVCHPFLCFLSYSYPTSSPVHWQEGCGYRKMQCYFIVGQ